MCESGVFAPVILNLCARWGASDRLHASVGLIWEKPRPNRLNVIFVSVGAALDDVEHRRLYSVQMKDIKQWLSGMTKN
jgi:hypothetical protein